MTPRVSEEMRPDFSEEIDAVLAADLPNRAELVSRAARQLELIADANRHFNLTRITTPREAAIKHVLDSVIPWQLFAKARRVLDAGTGAGFPGIPLAVILPGTHFTLSESIGKKARFVGSAIVDLGLPNAVVIPQRAEELARLHRFDIITARAVAPISKALELFGPVLKTGVRLLLYKGPDAEQEISESSASARKWRADMNILLRYDLPGQMGTRTVVEIMTR